MPDAGFGRVLSGVGALASYPGDDRGILAHEHGQGDRFGGLDQTISARLKETGYNSKAGPAQHSKTITNAKGAEPNDVVKTEI